MKVQQGWCPNCKSTNLQLQHAVVQARQVLGKATDGSWVVSTTAVESNEADNPEVVCVECGELVQGAIPWNGWLAMDAVGADPIEVVPDPELLNQTAETL